MFVRNTHDIFSRVLLYSIIYLEMCWHFLFIGVYLIVFDTRKGYQAVFVFELKYIASDTPNYDTFFKAHLDFIIREGPPESLFESSRIYNLSWSHSQREQVPAGEWRLVPCPT